MIKNRLAASLDKLVRCPMLVMSVLLPLLSTAAGATQYIVSTTGNDTNSGLVGAPWKTLQKAANSVVAGDIVLVNDGTYAGFTCRRSGAPGQRITFKAKHKWGARITSANAAGDIDWILLLSASYITIDGFEVSGATRAGICARSLGDNTGADTRNNIVQNCHCHHNGLAGGGAHDGIFTGFALNFTAQGNVVHHNGEHGIYVSNSADRPIIRRNRCYSNVVNGIQINADKTGGLSGADGIISNWLIERNIIHSNGGAAGINLDGCVNGICRNNLLYNNAKAGIAVYGIDGAVASRNNLFVNNTVYNASGSRAALLLADGANNNVVFNNILYSGNGAGIEINAVTGLKHDYNCVSSITGGALSAHESSPAASTLFKSIANANFHLSATSPALNSGIATFEGKSAPGSDLVGQVRPSGAGYDRGCYEEVASSVSGL